MGMHRGAAILQAREDVKFIGVRYYALSKWNKAPNKYSERFDKRVDDLCLSIPESPSPPPTEYNKLKNLDSFPFLIPKAEVCQILHIPETSCGNNSCANYSEGRYRDDYCALIDPASKSGIETTMDKQFVKKSSLEKYLGLTKPQEEKKKDEKEKADKEKEKP